MLDLSKLIGRGGAFKVATSGAVQDLTLLGIASEYETNVMRKVAGVAPDDWKNRVLSDEIVLETTKYDGEGVFIYFEAGKQLFCFSAPSGRARIGFPALTEVGKKLEKAGIKKALVRVEMWLPPLPDRRRGIADVTKVTFNGTEADVAEFKLIALDLIMADGKDLRANQSKFQETWTELGRIFGDDPSHYTFRMKGSLVKEKTLTDVFARKSGAGEEGIVIRRLDRPDMIKIKPYRTVDCVVIGYVEGDLEEGYGVTSILVGLTYPGTTVEEAAIQTFVRAGTGFSDPQRVSLLGVFQPLKVEAPLAMTDSDGRTIHFIKPQMIAEIGGEDLITQIGGIENRTQFLMWNRATGRYTFSGLIPVPRLTFPRFVRWRDDKQVEQGGARMEQILPNPVRPEIKPQEVRKSRMVRRAVYLKGAEMVRKLVIVENPPADERDFPFSVFWTDFSSKRAQPLKVSIQVARTEARARELGEILLKENIVRGWVLSKDEQPTAPLAKVETAKPEPVAPIAPAAPPKPVAPVAPIVTPTPPPKPVAPVAAASEPEAEPAPKKKTTRKKTMGGLMQQLNNKQDPESP